MTDMGADTMTAPLWTGEEMARAMEARPIHEAPAAVTGISIDSRTLKPRDAFFAIKGDRFDGHDYATAAAAALRRTRREGVRLALRVMWSCDSFP